MREANRNSNVGKFVRRVEMVQRRSIMYYQQLKSHPFLKIVVALPTMVASCRGKLIYYSRRSKSNILLILFRLILPDQYLSYIGSSHLLYFDTILCLGNDHEMHAPHCVVLSLRFLHLVSDPNVKSFVLTIVFLNCILFMFKFFLLKFENMAGILDRGIQLDGLGMKSFMTYESNVLFALRFMIDCSIVGGNWIEIPAGKYKKATKSLSYCQLEFDCLYPFSHGKIRILCLRDILECQTFRFFFYPLNNVLGIPTWLVMLQKGNIQRWLRFGFWVLTLNVLVAKDISPNLPKILWSRSIMLSFHIWLSLIIDRYYCFWTEKSHFLTDCESGNFTRRRPAINP